jgi:predicted unusual protein kinase regulating ubiquinone biosynthesis (AarF/ABC1/UbiB family)
VRRSTIVAGTGVAIGTGAVAVAAKRGGLLRRASLPLRSRVAIERRARVWKLTARNGVRFAGNKVRGVRASDERKAELDERFAIRTAQDVANELGQMKGAMMKAGQLVSFIIEALPDEAQAALATLQADAPPMAPSLAAQVVLDELGAPPDQVFLDWNPTPVAAASVGQVHRAVLRDGREVAVKVQYPGIADAIGADMDNVEVLYGLFGAFALKGLDTKAMVEELRTRMVEELNYRREAANQTEFAAYYSGHPFIRIPSVVPEYSTARVITSEWVDGLSWNEFIATSDEPARQRAAEVLWRFTQGSVHLLGAFNGDPHPGNYRFHPDGTVTFLDFGLVKRWSPGEWERLSPSLDGILAGDPVALVEIMEQVEFLRPGHGLDPQAVYDYVSTPYAPFLAETFRFDRSFVKDAVATILDINGPHAKVIAALNLPVSFVILDRVVWGISALQGKLGAVGPWRAMLAEYRTPGSPPASELGVADAAWRARTGRTGVDSVARHGG